MKSKMIRGMQMSFKLFIFIAMNFMRRLFASIFEQDV